jgi:hypothetical protein
MRREERPLGSVPAWVWTLLAAALATQIGWQAARRAGTPARSGDLPPAPSVQALRLASFGEPAATARLCMLYLQGFALQRLDYARLVDWLGAVLELDPRSMYPLFAAARVYAEVPDPARSRLTLEFVYREFLRDPNRRWPALAHAALLAKHRLKDLPLALRYAAAIDRYTTAPDVPLWAKQMQIFVLEDMDELEAARIVIGGLLQSGRLTDPAEAAFLKQRHEELEAKLSKSRR